MPEITALTQPTYWFPSYIDYIDYEEIQRSIAMMNHYQRI